MPWIGLGPLRMARKEADAAGSTAMTRRPAFVGLRTLAQAVTVPLFRHRRSCEDPRITFIERCGAELHAAFIPGTTSASASRADCRRDNLADRQVVGGAPIGIHVLTRPVSVCWFCMVRNQITDRLSAPQGVADDRDGTQAHRGAGNDRAEQQDE